MPSEAKYSDQTPADDFLILFDRLKACAESKPAYSKYQGKGLTFKDFIDGFARGEFEPEWGLWMLKLFGEDIEPESRLNALAVIKDPMQAFSAYLELPWLTDEEDKLLESKFKGKLPRAERELKDGVVKRLKNGGN
jgi:hypothetical protein